MRAFVVMPFDPEFTAVYERLIEPALREAGYTVARADSSLDQHNVMRGIVESIGSADIVVAELTSRNPNVLYELGLAHGLGIPTVLLAQAIDEIPFDLQSYRVQLYSTRFDEIDALRDALAEIAREHAAGQIKFGSPVSDFLPGGSPAVIASHTAPAIVGEEQGDPAGFLDRLLEMEEASQRLESVTSRIAVATEDVGEDIQRTATRIDALQPAAPGVLVQARRLASIAASDLTRYAERLEIELPALEEAVNGVVESGLGHVRWLSEQPGSDFDEQRDEFRASMISLAFATTESLSQVGGFRDVVLGLKGTSRELDGAADRVSSALGRVVALIDRTRLFAEEGKALLEDGPEH
ncbi:MAG TPA: hypothetical protein VFQ14_00255 [Thermoleophilaceae bacterium]|nr:hypothetical protein [Thermoleophilaceae bacterium]